MIGNDSIKTYFDRVIEKGIVPQSLLFAGPNGAGKGAFAIAFAQALLKTDKFPHPDIRVYKPEGKIGLHSIQSMRQFCTEVYLAPFQADRKVFIIHEAHRMLPSSANALLKTFEEPSLDSVIILISNAPDQLLPTVLSRCQMIRFQCGEKPQQEREEPLRGLIFKILAKDAEVLPAVKELAQQIELFLKEEEKKLRAGLVEGFNAKLSAAQSQAIEKEVDGGVSMNRVAVMQKILDAVISWYRDMHLIHVGGSLSMLMNPAYAEDLTQALQRGEMLPLEKVQNAVKKAMQMLERSFPINYCLEHLFLSIS